MRYLRYLLFLETIECCLLLSESLSKCCELFLIDCHYKIGSLHIGSVELLLYFRNLSIQENDLRFEDLDSLSRGVPRCDDWKYDDWNIIARHDRSPSCLTRDSMWLRTDRKCCNRSEHHEYKKWDGKNSFHRGKISNIRLEVYPAHTGMQNISKKSYRHTLHA